MTTQQFIEKAVQGGWDFYGGEDAYSKNEEMFLDPKAWQAVGKVEGWADHDAIFIFPYGVEEKELYPYKANFKGPQWLVNMVAMILELSQGKTLEEYIETL